MDEGDRRQSVLKPALPGAAQASSGTFHSDLFHLSEIQSCTPRYISSQDVPEWEYTVAGRRWGRGSAGKDMGFLQLTSRLPVIQE